MIGTGYVGLVSGACFSEFGVKTVCVDKDERKIGRLRQGDIPIFEPGLHDLVTKNTRNGHLSFTTDLAEAVNGADAIFIAVGTPSRRGDGHADLSYVFAAAEEIADALTGYAVIVTKSTVPVGTGRKVKEAIQKHRPDAEFDIASNPEFLREGSAIDDFMRPDRVVIGVETERAAATLRQLYRPLYLLETPLVETTLETAEITKYAANSFLATKITFINEVANLCEKANANVQDVARAIGLDGRIGRKFLHAGPGFGGSCFPKDTLAFATSARDYGTPQRIVEQVVAANEDRKRGMAERVVEACGGSVDGKTVAVLGLSFKPNTDDMREAPSLDIIPLLQEAGAQIRAYDPVAMDEASGLLLDVVFCRNAYDAVDGADCAVIVTEWNEFRALDLSRLTEQLRKPVVVDLRNIYQSAEMEDAGVTYYSIGRPPVRPEQE